jgi:glycosyltransferase involved in cell wall biosynthesis
LNQTFTDFEFLIIDDGSTDNSVQIIQSYQDHRIRLECNETNQKLIYTLNKGIDLAQGEYIARMDCDDISLPERLAKQVYFLDTNPDVGLCGTTLSVMNSAVAFDHPSHSEEIKCRLLFNCCINHPTVMMRKDILINNYCYYNYNALHAEDYDLWIKLANITKLANLNEVLLFYRMHPEQITSKYAVEHLTTVYKIIKEQLQSFGIDPTEEQLYIHMSLCSRRYQATKSYVLKVRNWLNTLKEKNMEVQYYPEPYFGSILDEYSADVSNYYETSMSVQKGIKKNKKSKRRLPETKKIRKKKKLRKKMSNKEMSKKKIRLFPLKGKRRGNRLMKKNKNKPPFVKSVAHIRGYSAKRRIKNEDFVDLFFSNTERDHRWRRDFDLYTLT